MGHVDAIHGTGRHAEFAARAVLRNDRVQILGSAGDRIHRAGVETKRTADAAGRIDVRHDCLRLGDRIPLLPASEELPQCCCRVWPARRAPIKRRSRHHGLRVRATAGMAALATLGLWQERVHRVHQGVLVVCSHRRKQAACKPQRQGNQGADAAKGQRRAHEPMPLRPKSASDMNPTVTNARGGPRKALGTALSTMRSRKAAKATIARPKPRPAPIARVSV